MSKSKFFTYVDQARAAAKNGENVHFAHGRGYYLVPPGGNPAPPIGPGPAEPKSGFGADPYTGLPTRTPSKPTGPHSVPPRPQQPAPPNPMGPLTPEQIAEQAGLIAQSQLDPQETEARRQQALAAAQARADEQAIQGFQGASAQILAGLAPQTLQGYLDASKEQGQLGQGLATGVSQDVAARVAADQAFMQSQGQQGGSGPDAAALHDTVYALGGQIPGDAFAEQGAAANAYALAQPAIALNAGREQIDARMAQARQENDQYAQQLLQLAAQYPGLKSQALAQLNQYEIDKANYREQVRTNDANIASQAKQDALAARSERAQEIAAGINAKNDQAALSYKFANLEFQTAKAQQAAQVAAQQGKRIDASASKVAGYLIDRNGLPITDASEKRIPVVKSASANDPHAKAVKARDDALGNARTTAFDFATKLLGSPVRNKNQGQILGGKGKFVASPRYASIPPGKPGAVYHSAWGQPADVATTDRPERAARSGAGADTYAEAQAKVWAEIDGDGLMSRYGLNREQVMAIVNKALKTSGWKRK